MAILNMTLDELLESTAIGSTDRAMGNALYGFNQFTTTNFLLQNRDNRGFLFFTRPQLNMQADNLQAERKFYPLITDNPNSLQRYIACALDPRLQRGFTFSNSNGTDPGKIVSCPLMDPFSAFIPILSNTAKTVSGWPSISVPVYTFVLSLFKVMR